MSLREGHVQRAWPSGHVARNRRSIDPASGQIGFSITDSDESN